MADRIGPTAIVHRTCAGCRYELCPEQALDCTHPTFAKPRAIGFRGNRTPGWCPVLQQQPGRYQWRLEHENDWQLWDTVRQCWMSWRALGGHTCWATGLRTRLAWLLNHDTNLYPPDPCVDQSQMTAEGVEQLEVFYGTPIGGDGG